MKSSSAHTGFLLLCLSLAMPSGAAVSLQIKKGTNSMLLSWTTPAGQGYTVQTAPAITGPWTAETMFTAPSTLANWNDLNVASTSRKFYRLLETPELSLTNLLFSGDGLVYQVLSPAPFGDSSLFVSAAQVCAYAVFLASQLNGNAITVTGTLTQTPGNTFTYGASPGDRLLIHYTNGLVTSCFVTNMLGDFNSDSDAFLHGDHYFTFRFANPGLIDMVFNSYHSTCGTNITTAAGTYTAGRLTNRVDLTLAGTYCFQSDSSGSELDESHTLTGTITNIGAALLVNQGRSYVDVISTSPYHDSSSGQDANSNRLTIGNDIYQFSNYYRRRDFTDGHPVYYDPSSSPAYWQATGSVSKNGAGYATHHYNYGAADLYLRFQIITPTDTIEVEKFTR